MNSINWPRYQCDRYLRRSRLRIAWKPSFFRLLLSNCLNWKINCDDHSSLPSTTAVQIWITSCIYTSHQSKTIKTILPLYIPSVKHTLLNIVLSVQPIRNSRENLQTFVRTISGLHKSVFVKPSTTYRFCESHKVFRTSFTLKFLGIQLLTFPIYLSFLP